MLEQLVDLPCIVESLKTTDRKSFYKTADISQVGFLNHCYGFVYEVQVPLDEFFFILSWS